jgi:hypothetical protein
VVNPVQASVTVPSAATWTTFAAPLGKGAEVRLPT